MPIKNDPEQHILVTGATGLIGTYATTGLLQEGKRVTALGHSEKISGSHPRLKSRLADLTQPGAFNQDDEPDVIIHCAAVLPSRNPAGEDVYQANRAIDDTLLDYLKQHKNTAIIYLSGASLYDTEKNELPINEKGILKTDNPYFRSKRETEEHLLQLPNPKSILRVSSPYGPLQKNRTVLQLFIQQALSGENLVYFGSGERTQDFIHGSDVGHAIVQCINRQYPADILNIVSGEPVTMKNLALLVKEIYPFSASEVVSAESALNNATETFRGVYDNQLARQKLDWTPHYTLRKGLGEWINQLQNV